MYCDPAIWGITELLKFPMSPFRRKQINSNPTIWGIDDFDLYPTICGSNHDLLGGFSKFDQKSPNCST